MNKRLLLLAGLCLAVLALSAARSGFAATTTTTTIPGTKTPWPPNFSLLRGGYWGPLITCDGNYSATGTDPGAHEKHCTSACDAIIGFEAIVYFVMTIILYVGAPVMALVGGGMIVFGGANPGMIDKGRKTLLGMAIGVALALSAYVLVSTFLWLVQPKIDPTGKTGVAWPEIKCDPNSVPGGYLEFNYNVTSTSNSPNSGVNYASYKCLNQDGTPASNCVNYSSSFSKPWNCSNNTDCSMGSSFTSTGAPLKCQDYVGPNCSNTAAPSQTAPATTPPAGPVSYKCLSTHLGVQFGKCTNYSGEKKPWGCVSSNPCASGESCQDFTKQDCVD